MRERTVENYLTRRVKEAGGKSYKWCSPSNRSVPDRIAFLPNGGVWFIEVKSPTGKLTQLQEHTVKELKKYTDNVVVVFSKEDVQEWLLLATQ